MDRVIQMSQARPSAIGRQGTGSVRIDPARHPWQETEAAGFLVKPIFADAASGAETMLMRIEPGAFFPSHSHDRLEEIYVVEGDFYDDTCTYGPGQYCQRAVGASHTAGSRQGCIVLLIYRP